MFKVEVDTSELKILASDLRTVQLRWTRKANLRMKAIGEQGVRSMRKVLRSNDYTGGLLNSVGYDQKDNGLQGSSVEIGPNKKRGSYDAGAILQLGTKPIPNVPWKPIVMWARVKGFDKPFMLWKKIQRAGIAPHPFINETLYDPNFQRELGRLQDMLGYDLQQEVIAKTGIGG